MVWWQSEGCGGIEQTIALWFFDKDVFRGITISQIPFHWEAIIHT